MVKIVSFGICPNCKEHATCESKDKISKHCPYCGHLLKILGAQTVKDGEEIKRVNPEEFDKLFLKTAKIKDEPTN